MPSLIDLKIRQALERDSAPTQPRRSFRERFGEKHRVAADGCWVWTRAIRADGYGAFQLGGGLGVALAHRVAYYLANGEVPSDMELDHLCRNRACVNPAHLEPVTHRENGQRGLNVALRAPKSRCPQGHDYAIHGRVYPSSGYMVCAACKGERDKRRTDLRPKVSRRRLSESAAQDVRERFAAGETTTALAERYGLSRATVHRIATGVTYRD